MFCLLHEQQFYLVELIPFKWQLKHYWFLLAPYNSVAHIFTSSPIKIHTYAHCLVLLLKISCTELKNKPITSSQGTILPTHQSSMAITCVRVNAGTHVGVPYCHTGISKDKQIPHSLDQSWLHHIWVNEYHLNTRCLRGSYVTTLEACVCVCTYTRKRNINYCAVVFECADVKL